MNYLAIDTSRKNLTVAVCKDGEIYKFYDADCGVRHSVALMKETEKLLASAGLELKDADFIAAVTGAGSFTGIRIGVSTVKALCFAFGKPCLPITSFDTLAYNKEKGKVLAVIDAGHGGFYVCGYKDRKVVLPPAYVMKEQLITLAAEYLAVAASPIDGVNAEIVCVDEGLVCAVAAKRGEATFDYESLSPLYVRKSQAEEGR